MFALIISLAVTPQRNSSQPIAASSKLCRRLLIPGGINADVYKPLEQRPLFFIWHDAYQQQLRDTELKAGGQANKKGEFICLRTSCVVVIVEKPSYRKEDNTGAQRHHWNFCVSGCSCAFVTK